MAALGLLAPSRRAALTPDSQRPGVGGGAKPPLCHKRTASPPTACTCHRSLCAGMPSSLQHGRGAGPPAAIARPAQSAAAAACGPQGRRRPTSPAPRGRAGSQLQERCWTRWALLRSRAACPPLQDLRSWLCLGWAEGSLLALALLWERRQPRQLLAAWMQLPWRLAAAVA